MPRVTKDQLQKSIDFLKASLKERDQEIQVMKARLSAVDLYLRGPATLTIALEKTTEALAHVIADLSHRR